jgi:hypothetical protein
MLLKKVVECLRWQVGDLPHNCMSNLSSHEFNSGGTHDYR